MMSTNSERYAAPGINAWVAQVRPRRAGVWRVGYKHGVLAVGYSPQQTFSLTADPSNEQDLQRLKALITLAQGQSPVKSGGLFISRDAMPFQSIFKEALGPSLGSVKTWTPDPLVEIRGTLSRLRFTGLLALLSQARMLSVPVLVGVVLLSAIWIEGALRSVPVGSLQPTDARGQAGAVGVSEVPFRSFSLSVIEKVSQELLSAGVESVKEIALVVGAEGGTATLQVALDASLSTNTLGTSEQSRQERMEKLRRAMASATGATVEVSNGQLRAQIKNHPISSEVKNAASEMVSEQSLQNISRRYGVVSEIVSSEGKMRLRLRQQPIQAIEALFADPLMQQSWNQVRLARGGQLGLADLDAELSTRASR